MEDQSKQLEKDTLGNNVKISNDVIAIIAQLSLNDVEGLDKNTLKGMALARKQKAIEITTDHGEVVVTVELVVKYGIKIPDLAKDIQGRIKSSVENMTGLTVKAVNVNIIGMNIEKSGKEA